MTEATTTVKNKCGIHNYPAAAIVQKASSFGFKIQIRAKGKTIDAKSILMILNLLQLYKKKYF